MEKNHPLTSPETIELQASQPQAEVLIKRDLSGVNNPMYGRHHSRETKQKISQSLKGKKHSEETREKISQSLKGKKHSEETRQKMSQAHRGKKHSEETRERISQAHRDKQATEATKEKLSQAKTGVKNPNWDLNIKQIKQAIEAHASGKSMRQASTDLNFSPSWLGLFKMRRPQEFSQLYLQAAERLNETTYGLDR